MIHYIGLSVKIYGLKIENLEDEMKNFLVGYLYGATKTALLAHHKDKFNFRDMLDSDIEVEIEEIA